MEKKNCVAAEIDVTEGKGAQSAAWLAGSLWAIRGTKARRRMMLDQASHEGSEGVAAGFAQERHGRRFLPAIACARVVQTIFILTYLLTYKNYY